jgi:hypothetical protein
MLTGARYLIGLVVALAALGVPLPWQVYHADRWVHAAPPAAANVPFPAAAAGYRVLTFSVGVGTGVPFSKSSVDTTGGNAPGFKLYCGEWFNAACQLAVDFPGDGSIVSKGEASTSPSNLVSANALPFAPYFRGAIFQPRGYFCATFKLQNNETRTSGWPAFWSISAWHVMGASLPTLRTHWAGTPSGYEIFSEPDFVEYNTQNGYPDTYVSNTHVHFGAYNATCSAYCDRSTYQVVDLGADNFLSLHRYCQLIMPATAATRGYSKAYVDDVYQATSATWTQFRNDGSAGPPPAGDGAYGVTDLQPLMLSIAGTDFNNMTITSIQVWQASASEIQTN